MSQFDTLFKNPKTKKSTPGSTHKRPPKTIAQMPVDLVTVTEKKKKGKSDDDRFRQVLTYLKKETHNAVKAALIFDDKKRDLSDLVEELLADWIEGNRNS